MDTHQHPAAPEGFVPVDKLWELQVRKSLNAPWRSSSCLAWRSERRSCRAPGCGSWGWRSSRLQSCYWGRTLRTRAGPCTAALLSPHISTGSYISIITVMYMHTHTHTWPPDTRYKVTLSPKAAKQNEGTPTGTKRRNSSRSFICLLLLMMADAHILIQRRSVLIQLRSIFQQSINRFCHLSSQNAYTFC